MLRFNCGCSWPAACSRSRLCHTRVPQHCPGGSEGKQAESSGILCCSVPWFWEVQGLLLARKEPNSEVQKQRKMCVSSPHTACQTLLPGPGPRESRAASSFLPCQTSYLLPCEITGRTFGWGLLLFDVKTSLGFGTAESKSLTWKGELYSKAQALSRWEVTVICTV